MRGLVATAEAREAAAKDNTAALQAARSLLLETPRPVAAQNPKPQRPGSARALDSSSATGSTAAPRDTHAESAAEVEDLHDAAEHAAAESTTAEGSTTAAGLDDVPVPHGGAAAVPVSARAAVGTLNLALASAAGDADADRGDSGGAEGAQNPETALHSAIADAEARRAAAKKQFLQLRSLCIGAQQARAALLSLKAAGRCTRGCALPLTLFPTPLV